MSTAITTRHFGVDPFKVIAQADLADSTKAQYTRQLELHLLQVIIWAKRVALLAK